MNLREFLQQCRQRDDLQEIDAVVSARLGLAEICREAFRSRVAGNSRVLLFHQVDGFSLPVIANMFGSGERMAEILRVDALDDFEKKIDTLITHAQTATASEALCKYKKMDEKVQHPGAWGKNISDLKKLPAITSWPLEEKPYLTLPLVFTRSPEDGRTNMGLYRAQILENSELALNFSPGSDAGRHLATAEKLEKNLDVAIVLGADPALYWLASAPLPQGCCEPGLYRALFGKSLPLSEGPETGIVIPTQSEIVIEGSIAPGDLCTEGPFGNHSGQYVSRKDCPLVRVKKISSVINPVVPMTVVGPPPSENIHLGQASRALIAAMLKFDHPEICDIQMPDMTIFHGVAVIQVNAAGRKNCRDLIAALRCDSPLKKSRLLVVVDEDIDIKRMELCFWRTVNQFKADRLSLHGDCLSIDATGVDPALLLPRDE